MVVEGFGSRRFPSKDWEFGFAGGGGHDDGYREFGSFRSGQVVVNVDLKESQTLVLVNLKRG